MGGKGGKGKGGDSKYKKVIKPREEHATKSEEEIRVTATGSVAAYISRAAKLFGELEKDHLVIAATGNALTKAVTAAEIIKRRFKGLHQVTKYGSQDIVDEFEPLEEGLDKVSETRHIAFLEITLSKVALDTSDKGYQPPIDESLVKEATAEEVATHGRDKTDRPKKKKKPTKSKGKGKAEAEPASKGKGKGKGKEESAKGKGKGKGKGKEEEPAKGKGKGKGKGKEEPAKGKGKGKGKEDPPKGKGKGKGKEEPAKGKGKGKNKESSKGKGKGKASKGWDDYDYPPARSSSKGKGKASKGWDDYDYPPARSSSKGKGKASKGWDDYDRDYDRGASSKGKGKDKGKGKAKGDAKGKGKDKGKKGWY